MPTSLDQLIANANAALASVSAAALQQQADDAAAILAAQQAAQALQGKLDTANAVLAAANATITELRAKLAATTRVDPPPSNGAGTDLGPLINALMPGAILDVKAMRDAGQGPFYSLAGVAVLKAAGAKILGDPVNPIPWEVRPGPLDPKNGKPTGGSGVNFVADGIEVGGFQPWGAYLFCHVGSPRRAAISRDWHLHDLLAPPCDHTDPRATPGLNTLVLVEVGSERGHIENVGRPDQILVTLGAGAFIMASNTTVTNWYGASKNEQTIRQTIADEPAPAPPLNVVYNNVHPYNFAGNTKEAWTCRVGGFVFNQGEMHGNARTGQDKGDNNVTGEFHGTRFSYNNPAGSQLDVKSGSKILLGEGVVFDQTAAQVHEGKSLQQAVSGDSNSGVDVAANVTLLLAAGVSTNKQFVSGPKRTGLPATVFFSPAAVAAPAR